MNLNKAMIIGNVTRDPEARTTPDGTTVTSFSVATNMRWTDKAGQKQEKVEYHNIVAWRKLGEICAQYLKRGSKIYLEGRLQTRNWDDAQGQKHWRTEIVAENMIMLQRASGQSGPYQPASAPAVKSSPADVAPKVEQPAPVEDLPTIQQGEDINVEDIPF